MSAPHFYRLRALLYNHRGGGNVLELREAEFCEAGQPRPPYRLRYQDDGDAPDAARRKLGLIDEKAPFLQNEVQALELEPIFEGLKTIQISLLPPLTGGFDGISYHLWIENGMSSLHLNWWLECPTAWQGVQELWDALMRFKP